MYFSGQGKVFIASRDAQGNPQNLKWVGNVSALAVAMDTQKIEHKESYTGQRLTDLVLETSKNASITATFEDWDIENLARVLRANIVTPALTTVTDELVPLTALDVVGISSTAPARFTTKGKRISSVTLTDGTGTPIPFVLGTHYRIASAAAGLIEIIALPAGSLVYPWKIDYTPGAVQAVGMFTQPSTDYYLLFDGLNTADSNKPVVAEFYKVNFNPAQGLPLINAELGVFEVSGNVLIDPLRSASDAFGQFGKITYNT